MVLSNLDYLRFLSDILTFATGITLLFIFFISPRRKLLNRYFALFATIFGVYSFLNLLSDVFAQDPLFSPHIFLNARLLMLVLLASTYYFFVANFVGFNHRLSRLFVLTIFIILLVATPAISTDLFLKNLSSDYRTFDYTFSGYLLLSIVLMCNLGMLWLALSNQRKTTSWLRLPAILFAIACGFSSFASDLPIDILIFSIAALWSARMLLRRQLINPLYKLNREIQNTNTELRQNINELAREKERVEQLNQELQDANRYKDEFFANVSHELRTPLNSIIGYSELLMSPIYGQLNKEQKDRLDRIHRNGMNLSNLIDAVLDLNELESAKLVLEIEEFDIHPVIDEALGKIQPFVEEKTLTLQTTIPQKLPLINGDARRIQQVIYNLLENAVKFTREGHVELQVQVISIQWGVSATFPLPADGWLPDGRWLLLQVADTGIGIAPESLEYIFTNFLQIDGSETREYGGLGLGLPISKRLVELHSGFIWVESTVEVGSTFYVALPIPLAD